MSQFPEQVGRFKLYPADPTVPGDTWSISYDQVWLPLLCTDREACEQVMAVVERDDWREIVGGLDKEQHRTGTFEPLTVARIAEYLATHFTRP